jgi:hypothetical protein
LADPKNQFPTPLFRNSFTGFKEYAEKFLTPSLPSSLGSKITCARFLGMTGIEIIVGAGFGLMAHVLLRALMLGFFTVAPNERAVLTSFGKAQRIASVSTLDTPLAEDLPASDRDRYRYPQLQVIGPGVSRWPWQQVLRSMSPFPRRASPLIRNAAGQSGRGQVLEAVTQDQLNIRLPGRFASTSRGQSIRLSFWREEPDRPRDGLFHFNPSRAHCELQGTGRGRSGQPGRIALRRHFDQ